MNMNTNQSGLQPGPWSNASGTSEASHAIEHRGCPSISPRGISRADGVVSCKRLGQVSVHDMRVQDASHGVGNAAGRVAQPKRNSHELTAAVLTSFFASVAKSFSEDCTWLAGTVRFSVAS